MRGACNFNFSDFPYSHEYGKSEKLIESFNEGREGARAHSLNEQKPESEQENAREKKNDSESERDRAREKGFSWSGRRSRERQREKGKKHRSLNFKSLSAKEPCHKWLFCGKRPASYGILCIFVTLQGKRERERGEYKGR